MAHACTASSSSTRLEFGRVHLQRVSECPMSRGVDIHCMVSIKEQEYKIKGERRRGECGWAEIYTREHKATQIGQAPADGLSQVELRRDYSQILVTYIITVQMH